MSLIPETSALLKQVVDETKGMREGVIPSPGTLFDLYNSLLSAYVRLGEEMCQKFSAKERAYLERKIAIAKHHRQGRIELKKTLGDATNDAILAAGEEAQREIDAMAEYEGYKTLLNSVDHSIDFIRSLNSYVTKAERMPASQPYS